MLAINADNLREAPYSPRSVDLRLVHTRDTIIKQYCKKIK